MFTMRTIELEFPTHGPLCLAAMAATRQIIASLDPERVELEHLARVNGVLVSAFAPEAERPERLGYRLLAMLNAEEWLRVQTTWLRPLQALGIGVRAARVAA